VAVEVSEESQAHFSVAHLMVLVDKAPLVVSERLEAYSEEAVTTSHTDNKVNRCQTSNTVEVYLASTLEVPEV